MASDCPVCGDEVEHVRRERTSKGSGRLETVSNPHTTLETTELCNGEAADRWDRICHRAGIEERDGECVPMLDAFYHLLGDEK